MIPPEKPVKLDGGDRSLEALRTHIDEIDARLIAALAERAKVVMEIGRLKRETGAPAYAPHREQEVLARVLAANPGPLPNRTIEAIYRELMSGSFALEAALRVGYLGPEGSFSHLAAVRHFGSSVELDDLHTIDSVFEEVAAGRVTYGLVPYENSIGGSITDTLDAFQEFDVRIYAETLVEITHCLLANCLPSEITRIYSKPQVFDQCRKWLQKHYPNAELIATASTAAAAQHAAKERRETGGAAIGSALAGEIYHVNILFERIEDKPNNITRFLILTRAGDQGSKASRTSASSLCLPSALRLRLEESRSASKTVEPHHGSSTPSHQPLDASVPQCLDASAKTTLMFATAHKPGALVDVLAVFRDANINLSHIDKRPSGRTNWEYTFFIDCEGSADVPSVSDAIAEARAHCLSLKVLGSYPRAMRVL